MLRTEVPSLSLCYEHSFWVEVAARATYLWESYVLVVWLMQHYFSRNNGCNQVFFYRNADWGSARIKHRNSDYKLHGQRSRPYNSANPCEWLLHPENPTQSHDLSRCWNEKVKKSESVSLTGLFGTSAENLSNSNVFIRKLQLLPRSKRDVCLRRHSLGYLYLQPWAETTPRRSSQAACAEIVLGTCHPLLQLASGCLNNCHQVASAVSVLVADAWSIAFSSGII